MNSPSPPAAPETSRELFEYWRTKVVLKNQQLLYAHEHLPAYTLRHNCTNYDELRQSLEVTNLSELERNQAITIIKYQCTTQVLQRRAGILRERSLQIQAELEKLNQQQTKRQNLIERLRRLLFSRDIEIKQLKTQVALLEAEKEELQVKSESSQADVDLHKALKKIEKELEAERKRRQQLGRNNQSLGGRVAHTERYKRERDEARAKVSELEKANRDLQNELNQLRGLPPIPEPKPRCRSRKNSPPPDITADITEDITEA